MSIIAFKVQRNNIFIEFKRILYEFMKNQCENITCLSISLIQSCYFFVVVVFLLSFCGWKCTVCCPIGGWNFVLVPRYQSLDRPVKRRRWILKKILTYLLHHSPFKCPSQFWRILTTRCQGAVQALSGRNLLSEFSSSIHFIISISNISFNPSTLSASLS